MKRKPTSAAGGHGARSRRPALFNPLSALVAVVVLGAGLVGVTSMNSVALNTSIPGTFFTVLDQQGVNDVPAQSDLTQMGRDDSTPDVYKLFWSWDSTDQWVSTGQTGDACSLFDYGTDGRIDVAVCGQVHNNPSNLGQVVLNHAPYVFRCDNSKADRCGQPSTERGYTSTQVAAGELGSPAAAVQGSSGSQVDLVTATDPFAASGTVAAGSNHPNDATLQVNISKTYLNGLALAKYPAITGAAKLVNVCSYPSAGNGGNNNPFDCVVTPGGGFLKIVKNASENRSWTFGVSPTPVGQPTSYTFATSTGSGSSFTGSSPNVGLPLDATVTVTEGGDITGWTLSTAVCTKAGGGATGTKSGQAVSGIAIESGQLTTCTFTNTRNTGSILIQKTDGTNPLGGAAFSAKLGAAPAVSIPLVAGSTSL
ncbi:MAG: hypothetical protein LC779_01655, partial [Actinobacteria bacterium]|nr:hypothetical protein [Actinomycetota bacterium]